MESSKVQLGTVSVSGLYRSSVTLPCVEAKVLVAQMPLLSALSAEMHAFVDSDEAVGHTQKSESGSNVISTVDIRTKLIMWPFCFVENSGAFCKVGLHYLRKVEMVFLVLT